MTDRISRILLGVAIPATVLLGGFVPYLAYRSELPSRVASHFDGSGTADGSMTIASFAIASGVVMLLGLFALVFVATWTRPLPAGLGQSLAFGGAFVAAFAAGILATTATSQRGIQRWQDATLSAAAIVVSIVVAAAIGALSAWISSHLPSSELEPAEGERTPAMALTPGEHAVWSATLRTRGLLYFGIAGVVAGALMAVMSPSLVAAALVLAGIVLLTFSSLRVTADRNGLRVNYGLVGWPRTTVPVSRISSATAIDVRPMQWGGWGYRGSLKLMRRAAVVHRAGPGIRLDLRDGKVFVVTVDDPEEPAALLNAEVDRLSV